MNPVLVTGAAGFIGSHVAAYLAEQGHEVIRSDISVPRSSPYVWKRADLTSLTHMEQTLRGVHSVCHIGGIGDVYLAADSPDLAIHVNGCGTNNALLASQRNNVRRFVYASTWEVYGDPVYQPVDEEHPCRPHHPYAISKLVGDLLAQERRANSNLQTTTLRLGTAYGRRMRPKAVIPAFVHSAIKQGEVIISGSGEQFRQFTHVSDIAKAFDLALTVGNPSPVYNIVASERTTIRSLAEHVAIRIPATVVEGPVRPGEVRSSYVDSKLAYRELGWKAEVSLTKGLNEFIDNIQAEDSEGSPSVTTR